MNPTWSSLRDSAPKYARSVLLTIGKMLRLTDTRGSRPRAAFLPSLPHIAHMAGFLPCAPEHVDLLGLELVEWHTGVLGEQRRAHQVHALLSRPDGGLACAGPPPDPVPKARRLRLDTQ